MDSTVEAEDAMFGIEPFVKLKHVVSEKCCKHTIMRWQKHSV